MCTRVYIYIYIYVYYIYIYIYIILVCSPPPLSGRPVASLSISTRLRTLLLVVCLTLLVLGVSCFAPGMCY